MSDDKETSKKIIIEGVTEEGKPFRPSDWAERMSGSLSTFKNHRIYYSPLLSPSTKDGNRCVVLDPALKETNPELYHHIMNFARANKLKICGEEQDESKKD
ncbi:MAG: DUF3579 domain-containing protein [Gammaproteobacteria bacterium]